MKHYIALCFLPLLFFTGIYHILFIIVAVVSFILGFTFIDNPGIPFFMKRYPCQLSKGIPKIIEDMKKPETESPKCEFNVSDNKDLNKSISEFMDLILRDYVENWYQYISADNEFLMEIRKSLNESLKNICSRFKRVDWLPVLTEDLPNELGSHIKLYRLSNQFCNRSKERNLHEEFFNLEAQSYKTICRHKICTDPDCEKEYLRKLSEFIIYIVCSSTDFNVPPIRYILREILVNSIFLPTLNIVCDPDFINQYIIWLCKDTSYTSEYFIQSLRMSLSIDEITAVKARIDLFGQRLRSRDSGGDDDAFIKAQLGSLDYVRKICESQLQKLDKSNEQDDCFATTLQRPLTVSPEKIAAINLDIIMERQVGVSLYLEYLLSIGAQDILKTYNNIIEYRAIFTLWSNDLDDSGEAGNEERQEPDVFQPTPLTPSIDQLKFARKLLLDLRSLTYFTDDESLIDIQNSIDHKQLNPSIFDPALKRIYSILGDRRFLDGFKSTKYFQQFLEEIDFFRDDSQISEEELMLSLSSEYPSMSRADQTSASIGLSNSLDCDGYNVRIVDSEIIKNSFVQYTLVVIKTDKYGSKESWKTFRRYRDFDSLHNIITDICGKQLQIKMPAKKPFNNMSAEFLEKRSIDLQEYLSNCLSIRNNDVRNLVVNFIREGPWDLKSKYNTSNTNATGSNGNSSSGAMNAIVNPLRNMGQAVMNMPDNMSRLYSAATTSSPSMNRIKSSNNNNGNNTVPGLWGPLLSLHGESNIDLSMDDTSRFNDATDQGKADNIPIRIMLLLVDEIFDLHNKSQVVRRGILGILRRIVKTFFGDKVNKIILDKAAAMTSANQAAELIRKLRDNMWPPPSSSSSSSSSTTNVRDNATRNRTRVLCRTVLLGSVSDELSQLLGNETTRQGVVRVFDLCQDPVLNRRLAHSILQQILLRLLPGHNLDKLMEHILCPARAEGRVCDKHQMSPPDWPDWVDA